MIYFILRHTYILLTCHFLGDYVLQTNFIAKTKSVNQYHMIVHCFLYSIPFAFYFGMDWRLIVILITHFIIDMLKSKYSKIDYVTDQLCHLTIAFILYLF